MKLTMKEIVRAVLRNVGLEVKRLPATADTFERDYIRGGRVPWSLGYSQAKHKFISKIIADPNLLEIFLKNDKLPEQFGVGFDERCIEYLCLLAHLPSSAKCILDAGSVLNHEYILAHPVFSNKNLHIMTLAPEGNCFWHKGISYLYNDLRCIPIQDNYYDAIVCISTLEHIGCDNTIYTGNDADREHRLEDFVLAMQELRRVLKQGGSLFLSVPFGVYRNLGMFQQFDRALLTRAIEAFGEASQVSETFYRYTAGGWQVATAQDCAKCEFVEWIIEAWQHHQWPDSIPVEPDLGAAARAVACVYLVKG
jgi:SAM-dependent methyltransferase